ncbi:MAG: sigma-54-dependent Fis family transcriptional regulator [Deltaproteobacteria bacterium]|nr:sigma-54-dependent Fis family transcriptional regulator [Deltaproteobacteria bacterium]
MANILIIDDDDRLCDLLSSRLRKMGHHSNMAHTLADGLRKVLLQETDVVFLDVMMPDGFGLNVLPQIKKAPSAPDVIIITGVGDPSGAELAIKSGAWGYVEKGSSINNMILPLTRALEYREEKRAPKPPAVLKRQNIIGSSPQIQTCLNKLAQAASSEANVLITGETGTGKEVFARAIHDNSSQSNNNFVVVDCTALPESLVESILFGHAKGAYTSADKTHEGLILDADGGTLFLDEVGELPLTMQKAFLRVLQEHRFRPLGMTKELKSDFRLVVATNRDLDKLVQNGEFRQDLLFRLRTLTIELPPLRERAADIRDIALYHITKFCARYGIGMKGVQPEFFEALESYNWPGNVRELVNTLETAVTEARHDHTLFPNHLPLEIRIQAARSSVLNENLGDPGSEMLPESAAALPKLREVRLQAVNEAEERYLRDLALVTKRDFSDACRIAGLSRSQLYNLIKKHGLSFSG